jgi:hypothetical protein
MDNYINYRIFPLLLDINYNMRQNDNDTKISHFKRKKRILPWKGEAKHALKKMEMYSRVNGKVHAALTTLPKTTVIYKVVIYKVVIK